MIEVQSNVLFLSTFGVEIDLSRMWVNAYLSIKNPKSSRAQMQIAHFAYMTPLCCVRNFQPQNLGPPLTKSWIHTCIVQVRMLHRDASRTEIYCQEVKRILLLKITSNHSILNYLMAKSHFFSSNFQKNKKVSNVNWVGYSIQVILCISRCFFTF